MEAEPGAVGTLFRNMRRNDASARQVAANIRTAFQALEPCDDQARTLLQSFIERVSGEEVLPNAAADLAIAHMPGRWGCFVGGMRKEEDFPRPS